MYEKYKFRTKKKLLEQLKQLGVSEGDAIEILEDIEFRKSKKYEKDKIAMQLYIDKILGRLMIAD